MFFLSDEKDTRKKAITYYRHSAEDKQENSVPIQREHAEKFVREYNLEIIHEEADEGKSGLLASRPGFERLFNEWILNDQAPAFDYVLVYDVSRWGRFQDQDEAAYYEFRCKQRGKKVIYVSRGFPKEEQKLISHLQTSIERYMAAEYSRQLSDKVFAGCVKVSQQGFSAGGTACYGMGRLLLDATKKPKGLLKRGEHKAIDNERVTFAPLNDETTEAVKTMFSLLIEKWYTPEQIANAINEKGTKSANGREWNREKVLKILTNETYTGTRIYNKTWNRLKQGHRANPKNEWVFCPDAFKGIINHETFKKAQEHLYWLMPTKYKRGRYITKHLQKLFYNELESLLSAKGIPSDNISASLQDFPVIVAVCFYSASLVRHWCFVVPPLFKRFSDVLCLGADLEKKSITHYFKLPTSQLEVGGFYIISEDDSLFSSHALQKSDLEKIIFSIVSSMVKTEVPTSA